MPSPLRQGKRRVMKDFQLTEISAVDRPAQIGARAVIMKRDDTIEKQAFLTTDTDGHSHLVDLFDYNRMPVAAGMTSYVNEHCHPWIMKADGTIEIGAAEDHTHTLAAVSKAEGYAHGKIAAKTPIKDKKKTDKTIPADTIGDPANDEELDMPEMDTKKIASDLATAGERIVKLEGELKVSTIVAEMNDAEKAHYRSLPGNHEKAEFLAKMTGERRAIVEKITKDAADANPVVHTAKDGTTFRKNDDPRLVAMAKREEEQHAAFQKLLLEKNDADLRKRAETDVPYLPGTVEIRAAILKAVDGISDEPTRKAAHESLKAHNTRLGANFRVVGTNQMAKGGATSADAEVQLDALAKKYATENKVDYYTAYEAVSKQQPDLLAKAIGPSVAGNPSAV